MTARMEGQMSLTETEIRAIVRDELERASRPEPEIMTREQVAELLQVDPHTVTKWVRRRGLPGMSLGSKWRFQRSAVMRWIEEQKT